MSDNPLHCIADWTAGAASARLPADAVALVRLAFLDTFGVTLLGTRLDAPRHVAAIEPDVPAQATVIGMKRRASVAGAAFINGTAAHAELFDDNNAPMVAHPSAPLVSALLPLAQSRGKTGRDLVGAYAAGFEIGVKLGRALNPELYEAGWHATRVLGVLGSAGAAAQLIGLDAPRIAHAVGIAASMAGGLRQNFGTMTMALHAGLTARDAVQAALLAERGFRADPSALDGKFGFFRLFGGKLPELGPLGDPLELLASGIIFKPYPSGAPSHAAVDASLALRERIDAPEAIARVIVRVHPWNSITLRDEPPKDSLQAKVNLRYCVAVALLRGRLTHEEFDEPCLSDPAIRALMQAITVAISADLPDNGEFPAEVEITLHDGRSLAERREVPLGGSSRPLGLDAVTAKFLTCASEAIDGEVARRIVALVAKLENLNDVEALCLLLEGRR